MGLNLPTFLVIGAQKAGTTRVYRQLERHPEVFPLADKELCYFDAFYDPRPEVYAKHFAGAEGYKAVGEGTPSYLYAPEAAARIHAMIPRVRLVAILRDPIDRAYSTFRHRIRFGSEHLDARFVEACARYPKYLEFGYYEEQLARYDALFPREQILVELYEDLKLDPQGMFDRICDHLGIARRPVDDSDSVRDNVGGVPRDPVVHGLISFAARTYGALRESPLAPLFNWGPLLRFADNTRNELVTRNSVQEGYPPLAAEERAQLLPHFRERNERLARRIGRDLSAWNR